MSTWGQLLLSWVRIGKTTGRGEAGAGGRGLGAAGEILAQQRGLGLGMQLQQRMLSRILFQADWRQECVLCHRKNVPSDRTANRAR